MIHFPILKVTRSPRTASVCFLYINRLMMNIRNKPWFKTKHRVKYKDGICAEFAFKALV